MLQATFVVGSSIPAGFFANYQDYPLGALGAGTHSLRIKADSGNNIVESNENDNEYTKTITVITPPVAFANATAITIRDDTNALPYPSTITVSNLSPLVNKVTATVTNLSHTSPHDVDILLVGPAGQKVVLMAHVGSFYSVTNVTLTFDGTASASLPNSSQLVSGTFLPTQYPPPPTNSFPPPAPLGPYGTALSVFNGTNPNGTWSLYVVDDTVLDSGTISGGWRLNISASAVLLSPIGFGTSGFQVRLTGPAGTYALQASTSLVSWASVATNTTSTGVLVFSDGTASSFSRRFYRSLAQ